MSPEAERREWLRIDDVAKRWASELTVKPQKIRVLLLDGILGGALDGIGPATAVLRSEVCNSEWVPEIGGNPTLIVNLVEKARRDPITDVSNSGFAVLRDDGRAWHWKAAHLHVWLEARRNAFSPPKSLSEAILDARERIVIHRDAVHRLAGELKLAAPRFWPLPGEGAHRVSGKSANVTPARRQEMEARAAELLRTQDANATARTLSEEFHVSRSKCREIVRGKSERRRGQRIFTKIAASN